METAVKVETAQEIARVFIFGENWRDHSIFCARCRANVPMVNVLTAAELDNTTNAEIFRRTELRELHHTVSPDGKLLICLSSLLG